MMADVLNMSTVLGHLPLVERPAAARAQGFDRVESWWDFASATPPADELEPFLAAVESAEVELVAINSHGGDRAGKERGLACLADRVGEFRDSIQSVIAVHDRLGPRKFNVTVGEMLADRSAAEQLDQAAASYRWAAQQVARFGGTILVEPLSGDGKGTYPFRTGYDVVEFLDERLPGVDNVKLMFDTYHLAANGVDILQAWDDLAPHVGHVQLADHPGRGIPGSGTLDLATLVDRVRSSDYSGDIAYEYLP